MCNLKYHVHNSFGWIEWLKCKAGGVTKWRISCLFAPAVDLAHCINNRKDEMKFFIILLSPWLLNAWVDVQWTAAKQSVFLPASSGSKFVNSVVYGCQITPKWENLQQTRSAVESKEKTTKRGAEKTGLIVTAEASLNCSPTHFLNFGFPGIACATGDSVTGCTWWEGCISEGSALFIWLKVKKKTT